MISAGIGRYGPFLLHDGTYANLESVEDVFTVGLNRAVTVLAEKQSKGGGRGRTAAASLKELGDHPQGGAMTVREGRYGPYINWGKVNATLPKGKDPQSVTVEEALALIAEKAGKTPAAKAKATKAANPRPRRRQRMAMRRNPQRRPPPRRKLPPNRRRPRKRRRRIREQDTARSKTYPSAEPQGCPSRGTGRFR